MAQNTRNAEIWSTRVQRELLALTTDNAPEDDIKATQRLLPPFVKVKDHKLDITQGMCVVSFLVEIKGGGKLPSKAVEGEKDSDKEDEAAASTEKNEEATTTVEGDTDTTTTEGGDSNEEKKTPASSSSGEEVSVITVTLDASFSKTPDGKINTASPAYPFCMPKAILTAGTQCFPQGSTVTDGSVLDIDCDWTPSLHLTDAVINIALKIKESILQQEPFHPSQKIDKMTNPIGEVLTGARRLSTSIGRSIRGLGFNVDLDVSERSSRGRKKRLVKKKELPKKPTEAGIGDEVNLLESPWVDAQGVYACKAIRRPEFLDAAIEHAAYEKELGGNTGLSGAFRSFTQSAKSVLEESFLMITETHIVEMKTSKLNLSVGTVTFAIPIELMAKLKFRRQESISLFFKTAPNEALTYMCPDSADAVKQIQTVLKRHGVKGKHTNAAAHRAIGEALQLVQEIQTKELALRHDPTVERVNEIMDLYRQAAERFEAAGDVRHEEVVTHMRKFLALPLTMSILDGSYQGASAVAGGDASAMSDTASSSPLAPSKVPQGEILERSAYQLDLDEDKDSKDNNKVDDDKAFELNMDNILKEAKEDFKHFRMDGEVDVEEEVAPTTVESKRSEEDIVDDAFADLDAMLNEADKELAELMSS